MSRGEREVMYSIKYAANPIGIFAQWMFSIGSCVWNFCLCHKIRGLPKKPAPKNNNNNNYPTLPSSTECTECRTKENSETKGGKTKTKKLRSENLVLLRSASLCFRVCVCACFIFVLRFGPAKTTAKRKEKKKKITRRKSVSSSLRHNLCSRGRNFICDAKNSLQAALFDTFLPVCVTEHQCCICVRICVRVCGLLAAEVKCERVHTERVSYLWLPAVSLILMCKVFFWGENTWENFVHLK